MNECKKNAVMPRGKPPGLRTCRPEGVPDTISDIRYVKRRSLCYFRDFETKCGERRLVGFPIARSKLIRYLRTAYEVILANEDDRFHGEICESFLTALASRLLVITGNTVQVPDLMYLQEYLMVGRGRMDKDSFQSILVRFQELPTNIHRQLAALALGWAILLRVAKTDWLRRLAKTNWIHLAEGEAIRELL